MTVCGYIHFENQFLIIIPLKLCLCGVYCYHVGPYIRPLGFWAEGSTCNKHRLLPFLVSTLEWQFCGYTHFENLFHIMSTWKWQFFFGILTLKIKILNFLLGNDNFVGILTLKIIFFIISTRKWQFCWYAHFENQFRLLYTWEMAVLWVCPLWKLISYKFYLGMAVLWVYPLWKLISWK